MFSRAQPKTRQPILGRSVLRPFRQFVECSEDLVAKRNSSQNPRRIVGAVFDEGEQFSRQLRLDRDLFPNTADRFAVLPDQLKHATCFSPCEVLKNSFGELRCGRGHVALLARSFFAARRRRVPRSAASHSLPNNLSIEVSFGSLGMPTIASPNSTPCNITVCSSQQRPTGAAPLHRLQPASSDRELPGRNAPH